MQNGTPGHAAKTTIQKFIKRGIRVIQWPAYNPDLNPIKTAWDKMKNWIQDNYGEKFNYDELRGAVDAAWEYISIGFLNDLVDSMQARCERVIRTNGIHTEY